MVKSVDVSIKGITDLLMHRFPLEPIEAIEKMTREEQAEVAAYREADTGELYVPGIAVQSCLVAAAAYSKGKGRASLQKSAAACVMVSPERILLHRKDYTIDSRPIVNPSTKGRIIRHRPRIIDWNLDFEIEFDSVLITEAQLRKIVDDAGSRVGLLDFRPARKGSFGRFMVTSWNK